MADGETEKRVVVKRSVDNDIAEIKVPGAAVVILHNNTTQSIVVPVVPRVPGKVSRYGSEATDGRCESRYSDARVDTTQGRSMADGKCVDGRTQEQ